MEERKIKSGVWERGEGKKNTFVFDGFTRSSKGSQRDFLATEMARARCDWKLFEQLQKSNECQGTNDDDKGEAETDSPSRVS